MKALFFVCGALALIICSASARAGDQIRIVGSSTIYPFATAVAEHFGKTTGFKAPVVESTGSGGGLKLFCAGLDELSPDIAAASRRITPGERSACATNSVKDVVEIVIGYDGLLIANAKSAKPYRLTHQQLFLALAKTVPQGDKLVPNPYRRWKDIDPSLPADPIMVFGPALNHGTRDSLVELVMDQACREFPAIQALDEAAQRQACDAVREDGAFIDVSQNYTITLQKLVMEPHAVGILPFSYLDQNRDKIQAAIFDGQEASYDNIFNHTYPLSRPLYLYVKAAHLTITKGLKEYVEDFASEKVWGKDGLLAERGLIAMPDQQRQAEAAKIHTVLALEP